jgi:hypothetical protein
MAEPIEAQGWQRIRAEKLELIVAWPPHRHQAQNSQASHQPHTASCGSKTAATV